MSVRLTVVFLICFLCFQTFSQEIKFENITTKQGLSHNSVTCIYQDNEGYIWLGTEDGLNRFDGYSFTVFRSKVDDTTSLTDNIIKSILEDSNGNLWVMSSNGNLNRYNRETGKFKQYLIDKQVTKSPVSIDAIDKLYEDRQHNLWAYKWSIYKYLPDKDIFEQINVTLDKPNLWIHFMLQDSNNQYWLATNNGLYRYNFNNGTFKCYKPQNQPSDPDGDIVYSISEDIDGILWLGGSRGLYKFDKNSGVFMERWQLNDSINPKIKFLEVRSLANDTKYLWLGWQTFEKNTVGIARLNKGTGELNQFKLSNNKLLNPSDNVPINLFEDKSGLLWVGTFLGGVYKFEKEQKFSTFLKGNTICSFLEDTKGYLWIATAKDGLIRTDKNNTSSVKIPGTDLFGPVNTIIKDSEGSIWFGTYNGLFYIASSEIDHRAPSIKKILDGRIKTIVEDNQHRLWIGLEGGLCVFNPSDGKKTYFSNDPNNANSLSHNSVEDFALDKQTGNIWIASWNGLNLAILPKNKEITNDNIRFIVLKHSATDTNSLSENKVISLCIDNNGNLWAGTYGGGINEVELIDNGSSKALLFRIKSFTIDDGLPNDIIYGILADKHNNIWISTNEGLSVLNTENSTFKNFDIDDGIQSNQFFWRAYYQSPSGKMYFGGVNGYNSFMPDSISLNTYLPPVKIAGFSIFNKLQIPGAKGSPLKVKIEETREITIHHNQSVISFDYVALTYQSNYKTRYAYKMEGFDNDWQYVDMQRKATYTNLDPGTYTFKVKATNNDGIWNETSTSIKLIIKPPYWMTWWFRIMVLAIGILFLFALYALRVKAIRQRNRLLERLVEERTHELKQSNELLLVQSEELNETNTLLEERQQLIEEQSEELMAQKDELLKVNEELQNLNATKDKFFSIIAHDIKNPFNAILGFSELFFYNIGSWTDEKKLQIAKIIYTSSKNLYQLLENLLQWSRSQRGLIEFKPVQTDLNQQIKASILLLKDTSDAKNIAVKPEFSENEIIIDFDLQMLDTILRNIISNAIKFSYPESTILIKAERKEGFALVSVTDNGMGMPPEKKENLFKLGAHQSTSGTNNEKGTGLGLILVKEFIVKHSGEIWVESEEGKGSTFNIKLPLPTED